MTTSDGIKDLHWDEVTMLASDIVNMSATGSDTSLLQKKLIRYLAELETIYGRLPSIVATVAEYTSDAKGALALLKEAYSSACEIGDDLNKTMLSSSLAEYYIEEVDIEKAAYWLAKFKQNREKSSDDYFDDLYHELSQSIQDQESVKESKGLVKGVRLD